MTPYEKYERIQRLDYYVKVHNSIRNSPLSTEKKIELSKVLDEAIKEEIEKT